MYLTLMVKGLLRHRRSGRRLFVLFALCSAAVLFFLTFRDSFTARYRQLAIDTSTAHLQIMPSDSPKLSPDGACTDHREAVVLLDYTQDLERFLRSLPAVESVMLALESKAAIYTAEGEPTGFTPAVIGVDTLTFARTLPGVRVTEGEQALAWTPSMRDIPVFRSALEESEIVWDNDRFVRDNFRLQSRDWESFKLAVARDMPGLFADARGPLQDRRFLASMNQALDRADLPALLPSSVRETYDYRVDDAVAALEQASADPPPHGDGERRLKVLRKRLLQSVYPQAITPVRDAIELNAPYTLAIPSARSATLGRPVVFPIKMTAYVQSVPFFPGRYYVDGRALRARLGVSERQGTNLYVRLASEADVPAVKEAVAGWIAARHLPYVVKDHQELGKIFASTTMALGAITSVLIVLFVATVTIFVVNTALLAVVKRRREIGTWIALGLSPAQNVVILCGEILVLVLVSWAIGSIIGTGVILLFHRTGMPGVVFMPGSRLFLDFRPVHLAVSFAVLFFASGVASLVPLLRLVRVKPVELLKEAA
ncbi:ABC transporter permease [Anaeromyxobacter oryzisoli]|uniref:ABC transporter permease n=1 Tax=Anaeromyxobacter oryzisoli TaxID=2925408 RepID=UPI001F586345|nr:FtsX-like permease family protein [Anaeromyxobacter sp. SG63]